MHEEPEASSLRLNKHDTSLFLKKCTEGSHTSFVLQIKLFGFICVITPGTVQQ